MYSFSSELLVQLTLLLFIPFSGVHSQPSKCGTASPNISSSKVQVDMDPVNKGTPVKWIKRSGENEKYEYQVAVHFVVDPNSPDTISSDRLDNQFKQLNKAFFGADLRFTLSPKQISRIEAPSLSDFNYPSEEDELFSNYKIPGIINVFCVQEITTDIDRDIWQGFTYHPEDSTVTPDQENVIVITFSGITEGNTLIHEFGHFFGLYHTHEGYDNPAQAEHVSGQDCLTKGDLICDTPADPNLIHLVDASDPTNCHCDLEGITDPNGLSYRPLVENFMSYAPPICRKSFTTGQLNRMNYYHFFVRRELKHKVIRKPSQIRKGEPGAPIQVVRNLSIAQARARLEGRPLALVFIYAQNQKWARRMFQELHSPALSHFFNPEEHAQYYLVATSLEELGNEQGVRDFLGNTLAPSASVPDHPFLLRLWPEIAPTPGLYIVDFGKEWLSENEILFSHPGYLKPYQLKRVLASF